MIKRNVNEGKSGCEISTGGDQGLGTAVKKGGQGMSVEGIWYL